MNHYLFVVRRILCPCYIDTVRKGADAHGHTEHDAILRSLHLIENTPNKDRRLSAELP